MTNIEIDQQMKFTDQFCALVEDAPKRFLDKWDRNVRFENPSRKKLIPAFNGNSIDLLSIELKRKFIILRDKYYAKSL